MNSKPPKPTTSAPPPINDYRIGDEISFAGGQGMLYGTVTKVIQDPASPAIEIEFEDGHKETKKIRDRALRLLRRASGKSEMDESRRRDNKQIRDYDVEAVRLSEQRRGSRH